MLVCSPRALTPKGHTTSPPYRFTEASLIRELEDRGIGRPSTYAAILQTILSRGYVWKKGSALIPTFTAFAVTQLLESHFTNLIDYDFTARMETDLDKIAAGEEQATPWLKRFYFGAKGTAGKQDQDMLTKGLKHLVTIGIDDIDARAVSSIQIGKDDQGRDIMVRVGRYGPYLQVGDTDIRSSIRDDLPPRMS